MDWKYLFTSLEGRIGRQSYWTGILAIFAINVISWMIDALLGTIGEHGYGLVSSVVGLIMIYPAIMLYAKRWHDRDKSGWWTLISLVPVIGGLWMLIECGFLRGTEGPNRFGPDPLAA
ncbi:MAG: DUF805 domain-containing protein [Aestuariivirga sp.]|jgi:uncharacterized membrane protein YhaH (DUF805 family)|uniref:DUF805 domain-containing protein n=1 Tax=Aestuariivirga sp. TaxID=2650926 RepID=UPI0038D23B37